LPDDGKQVRCDLVDPLERLGDAELALSLPEPLDSGEIEVRRPAESRPPIVWPAAVGHEECERPDLFVHQIAARHRSSARFDRVGHPRGPSLAASTWSRDGVSGWRGQAVSDPVSELTLPGFLAPTSPDAVEAERSQIGASPEKVGP